MLALALLEYRVARSSRAMIPPDVTARYRTHLSDLAAGSLEVAPVKGFRGILSDETDFLALETISVKYENGLQRKPANIAKGDQQWSSIMSAFLTFLYREYCAAILVEMKEDSNATDEIA